MNNLNVLIGGRDKFFSELSNQLITSQFIVSQTRANTLDVLYQSIQNHPNVCFISSEMNDIDELIENLMKLNPRPYIFIVIFRNQLIRQTVIKNNPYVTLLHQPVNLKNIIQTLFSLQDNYHCDEPIDSEYMIRLHNHVSETLSRLCITPNYNGFAYLREAIKLAVLEPVTSRCFSKRLYPKISKNFNSTNTNVERNIRTVIMKGWDKASIYDKAEIFGACAAKSDWHPTNGETILIIADRIQRKLENELKQAN